MKNLLKTCVMSVALFLGLSVLATPARAINLDEAWMKMLDAIGSADYSYSNLNECLNLKYVGSSTQAVVAITPTAITAYEPFNVLSTEFGTASGAYTIGSGSYATMGALCDAIDALASYKCQLRGCKRSDNSNLLRDMAASNGGLDLQLASGFTALFDTGDNTGDTYAGADTYNERIGITPATGRRVLLKACSVNANVAGTLNVYGQLRKFENANDGVTRDDTTLAWSEPTADDTTLSRTWSINGVGGLEFGKGQHVVISGGNGTGVQAAANFITCQWEER